MLVLACEQRNLLLYSKGHKPALAKTTKGALSFCLLCSFLPSTSNKSICVSSQRTGSGS